MIRVVVSRPATQANGTSIPVAGRCLLVAAASAASPPAAVRRPPLPVCAWLAPHTDGRCGNELQEVSDEALACDSCTHQKKQLQDNLPSRLESAPGDDSHKANCRCFRAVS